MTSKHKKASFAKSKVQSIQKESSDGKHALVEWRNTWEKADAWDEDETQKQAVELWREYCLKASRPQCPHQAPTMRRVSPRLKGVPQWLSKIQDLKTKTDDTTT